MNKKKSPFESLPVDVEEVDALRLENLVMKLNAAQAQVQQIGVAYNAAFEDAARKYKFNPKEDAIDFATWKVVRK